MQLIKIADKNGQKVVSARELHEFLGSRKDFSSWIKGRIIKYGLIDGQDFTKLPQKGELSKTGQTIIEYALSIDAAKELAMVEGNAKGKQARQYFIECEKGIKSVGTEISKKDLAIMVLKAEEEKEKLQELTESQENKIIEDTPKVEYYENVLTSESTIVINVIAKELGMSAKTLNILLQSKGVQYKQRGTWVLTYKHQDKGYTKTNTHAYTDSEGKTQTSIHTVWTEKGREFIHNLFRKNTELKRWRRPKSKVKLERISRFDSLSVENAKIPSQYELLRGDREQDRKFREQMKQVLIKLRDET